MHEGPARPVSIQTGAGHAALASCLALCLLSIRRLWLCPPLACLPACLPCCCSSLVSTWTHVFSTRGGMISFEAATPATTDAYWLICAGWRRGATVSCGQLHAAVNDIGCDRT